MKATADKIGRVYVLEVEELPYFKIGFSTGISKRLGDIRTGLPIDVDVRTTIRASKSDETKCHQMLKPWRARGEWFFATSTVTSFVEELEDWALYAEMRGMRESIRLGELLANYTLEPCDNDEDLAMIARAKEGYHWQD